MSEKLFPVAFVGHGSPMNAISSNDYTRALAEYSKRIEVPAAIVVFSAHWLTRGTYVTGSLNPVQIYDFYGFPQSLYNIIYNSPGKPELALQLEKNIEGIQLDTNRGIDHAAWAVARHMYPGQNVPILEISLDVEKSPIEHFEFARNFIEYRKQNILFIGSGNLIHNLRAIEWKQDAAPYKWAADADEWLKDRIESNNIEELVNYRTYLLDYQQAIPTNEHYLPMLYVMGMKVPEDNLTTIHESIQNGSISMRSFELG